MSYAISAGGYTQLERRMATSAGFSVGKAVEYLKQDARIRCVRETLERCSNMQGADRRSLKEALVSLLMENNPGAKRETIDKNVRNWLADDMQIISKGYAIQLAYALRMPIENADVWLTRLSGEAFHWRNPEDIVWIFGLANGLDYAEANRLKERIKEKKLLDVPGDESITTKTKLVRQKVAQLHDEAELEAFLKQSRWQLGTMHNTAYTMFCDLLNLLQNPSQYTTEVIPAGSNISVSDVISTYMYNSYIPRASLRGGKRGKTRDTVKSAIERGIKKNWPDGTTLSKMKNREIDVTRKVLILLFLATDGGVGSYADENTEDDLDADEIFESMEMRLNLMLTDCGFAQLDSRSPFDWMVLYCMYADESIFLENYMSSFLEHLFQGSISADEPNA